MVQISDDLAWQLAGKQNCFVKGRKGGPKFTADPSNLTSQNKKSIAGTNGKAIGIAVGTDGKKRDIATLTLKTSKSGTKPSKGVQKVVLRMDRGTKRLNKTVKTLVADQYYKPQDLSLALARVTKIAKATRRKQNGVVYKSK